MKVRVKFSKYGPVKFIGHLDVMRYFLKAIRRAEIDIAYSEGFSPHQIMSFAAPLSVGHTSEGEYLDMELNTFTSKADLIQRLQAVMVEGIDIIDVQLLKEGEGNAMASVKAASYLITFRDEISLPKDWQDKLKTFYRQPFISVVKKTKKGEKEINLKDSIYELEIRKDSSIYMLLDASSGGNIKPGFVLECFFETLKFKLPEFAFTVHRVETYKNIGTEEERKLVPLIWEK